MPLTTAEARDEMLALVKVAADTVTGLVVIYDDTKGDPPTDGVTPWCRVNVRHLGSGAATLRSQAGERRYRRFGRLTMQLFTAFSDGLTSADTIAETLRNGVEGKDSQNGVLFREVGMREIGQDGSWLQTNINAEFEYDELR